MRVVMSVSVLLVALPLFSAGCATNRSAESTATKQAFASPDAVILVKGMT